eukprot:m.72157 g.72157  ORF g.72157 m.72157 type:complete len:65 (-) comp18705_c0_seq1:187-381(-)
MDDTKAKATLDASADEVNAKLIATAAQMSETIVELEDRADHLEKIVQDLTTVLEAAKDIAVNKK